jgi:hypothetical protein
MKKDLVITKKGLPQRKDVVLNLHIAHKLRDRLLNGIPMLDYKHPKGSRFDWQEGGETKSVWVKPFHYDAWIRNGNAIPETGEILREFIDKAKAERREIVSAKRRMRILENSERAMEEMSNGVKAKKVRKIKKVNEQGEMVVVGEIEEIEDKPEVQAGMIRYATERLDSKNYGNKSEVKNSHLVFSLGDLRMVRDTHESLQNNVIPEKTTS